MFKREFVSGHAKKRTGPFTRPDIVLCSSGKYVKKLRNYGKINIVIYFIDWNTLIIGKLSPYIKVDSKHPSLKKNSEETLKQELALASHLGLVGVTFKLTKGIKENANLSRIICGELSSMCSLQVYRFTK